MARAFGFIMEPCMRLFWNFLVNIVPDNQICKIKQHIDSVETSEFLKFIDLLIQTNWKNISEIVMCYP